MTFHEKNLRSRLQTIASKEALFLTTPRLLRQPKTNMLGKVVQIYPITVRLELNLVDTIPVLF